jgi:hypothetical protein
MAVLKYARRMVVALVLAYLGATALDVAQVSSGAAIVTTNVNMREGPGTNFPVVSVLRSGEQVQVNNCRSNWCLVDFGRDRGWISQSFLRTIIASPGPGSPRPPIGGPIFGPGPVIGLGRACFFESADFRGRSFCLRQGEEDNNLGRWDNRITSILIEGRRTSVEACTDRRFRDCRTFVRSVPLIDSRMQQNISAVSVW